MSVLQVKRATAAYILGVSAMGLLWASALRLLSVSAVALLADPLSARAITSSSGAPGQFGPGQLAPGQLGPGESAPSQLSFGQTRPGQLSISDLSAGQMAPNQLGHALFVPLALNGGEPPIAQPLPTATPPQTPQTTTPSGSPTTDPSTTPAPDATPSPSATPPRTPTPAAAPIPTSPPFDVERPTDPSEVVFSYGVSGRWCTTVPQADEWVFRQLEEALDITLYGDNLFVTRDTRPGLSLLLGRRLTSAAARQFLSNLVAAVRFHQLPETLTVTQCADFGTANFVLYAAGEQSDVRIHQFLCSGAVHPAEYGDEVQLLRHIMSTTQHLDSEETAQPLPVELVTLYARRFAVRGDVPEWTVNSVDLAAVAGGDGELLESDVARDVVETIDTGGTIYNYCGDDLRLKAFSSAGSTYVVGARQVLVVVVLD